MQLVRECLSSLLVQIAHEPELVLVVLQEMWPQIAGPELARHLVPVHFEGGCLTLRADSEDWGACLDFHPALSRSINRLWGIRLVERIRSEVRQS